MDHLKNSVKCWALGSALLLTSHAGWGDDIANCKAQGGTILNLHNGLLGTGITVSWTRPNGVSASHTLAPVTGYGLFCCKRGTKIYYAGSCGCPGGGAECAMGSDDCAGNAYGNIGTKDYPDCVVEVNWDHLEV